MEWEWRCTDHSTDIKIHTYTYIIVLEDGSTLYTNLNVDIIFTDNEPYDVVYFYSPITILPFFDHRYILPYIDPM